MSNDRRAPWWYSGDDEQPEPDAVAVPDADSLPGADALPSADALPDVEAASGAEADGAATPVDWTALVAGAARMVDWATERVMAPHADHTDPAEHPECMVCRTVTLIGDPVGLMGGGQSPAREEADPWGDATAAPEASPGSAPAAGAQPIRWIPIVEAGN